MPVTTIRAGFGSWTLALAGVLACATASAADPPADPEWVLQRCDYDVDQAALRLEWWSGADPATATRRGVQIGDQDAVFQVAPETFAVRRSDVVGFELRSVGDPSGLSTFAVLLRVNSDAERMVLGDVTEACSAEIRKYFAEHRLSAGRSN